ncbi:hypothetical protein BKA82DRAFT_761783 [Pisolithus tinctorius]|uniref:Thymidylate synthase/dCMP hydroxymethylase domain-containing protein n=1 Tax=Pisolithus tinctorius Marx 270 TaxID=870435 RepID=A0A0C3J4S0_PISTI|nr:hypothetical protein BKA82DRAFT_761783 [Pisolithus tinctorius]KIN92701.1 hypothetical protein M404DRAFT_761783 [Pisolithus tinctorius Marx 270]
MSCVPMFYHDLGLGIPPEIASHDLLTHIVVQVTDTEAHEAHELIVQLGGAHVYKSHVEALELKLECHLELFPKLRFKELKSL